MDTFDQWFEKEFCDADLSQPDTRKGYNNLKYGWQAAKQSMQNEAVAKVTYIEIYGRGNMQATIEADFLGVNSIEQGDKLYTHAPDDAAVIADLQAQVEALRKDADAFRKMVRHNMQVVVTQKSDSLSLGVTDAKSTASGSWWHTASHIKDDAFEATRTAINRCADAAIKGGE